ncbi:MAG: bifunctional phosphopantothenoylcysteine decarboxylase/phosphopantothenate--cysteine ligase CoaBC [Pseudomonadota bacterium]
MASITIRNLDDETKQALRERAAQNGRSMEQEVRCLLDDAVSANQDSVSIPRPILRQGDGEPISATIADDEIGNYPGTGKSVLLIISGGIAAYKSLDLIRRLRERGVEVRCVMTDAAAQFVTPMAVGAIAGGQVFADLWDRTSEQDIGHIRLSREADLVIVAPATANLMAKMAHGLADDLASAVLLANNRPVLIAPAMNPQMWANPATRRNAALLAADGISFVGPASGEMAESGEAGRGRMAEPLEIVAAAGKLLDDRPRPLAGIRAVVTSGPTHEPIDPVRYIANRSSGKQGHAIARTLAQYGADVTLVSGPVNLPDPYGVETVHVETAREMASAVEAQLPCDLAVMVAAVADWRSAETATEKMKKQDGKGPGSLDLIENPDILKMVGHSTDRPRLVIGFAAETQNLETNARAKLKRKNADWIIANDVSPEGGVMGGDRNQIAIIDAKSTLKLPDLSKNDVAAQIVARIVDWFAENTASA